MYVCMYNLTKSIQLVLRCFHQIFHRACSSILNLQSLKYYKASQIFYQARWKQRQSGGAGVLRCVSKANIFQVNAKLVLVRPVYNFIVGPQPGQSLVHSGMLIPKYTNNFKIQIVRVNYSLIHLIQPRPQFITNVSCALRILSNI